MGRIATKVTPKVLDTQTIVERQVDQFISDSTDNYAIFFKGAPTFITYYSKLHYDSDNDRQFEAYNEAVGDESPIKYNKIENFPVWSMETSEFGSDETEYGYNGNVTTSFYILPNQITPHIDDQCEITLASKKYLFTVVSTESDNMNHSKFYKVTVKLYHYDFEQIQKQVEKHSEIDYGLLLNKRDALKSKDHASLIDKLRNKFDLVLETYRARYYNEKSMVFHSETILDQYLNFFIRRNELNKPFEQFRSSTIINPSIEKYIDGAIYEDTLYDLMEKENLCFESLERCKTTIIPIHDKKTPYRFNFFLPIKHTFVEYLIGNPQFCDGVHIPVEPFGYDFNFNIEDWLNNFSYDKDEGFVKNQSGNIVYSTPVRNQIEYWMKEIATRDEYNELVKLLNNMPSSKNILEKLLIRLKFNYCEKLRHLITSISLAPLADYSNSNNANIIFVHEYCRFIRDGKVDEERLNILSEILDEVNLTYYDDKDNEGFHESDYYNGALLLYAIKDLFNHLTI